MEEGGEGKGVPVCCRPRKDPQPYRGGVEGSSLPADRTRPYYPLGVWWEVGGLVDNKTVAELKADHNRPFHLSRQGWSLLYFIQRTFPCASPLPYARLRLQVVGGLSAALDRADGCKVWHMQVQVVADDADRLWVCNLITDIATSCLLVAINFAVYTWDVGVGARDRGHRLSPVTRRGGASL